MTQKLLSDEELRSELFEYAEYFTDMTQPESRQDGWYITWQNKFDKMLELINTQKRLYAESILGDVLSSSAMDIDEIDSLDDAFEAGSQVTIAKQRARIK